MTTSQPSRWQVGLVLAIGVLSVSMSAVLVRLALAAANLQGVGFSLVLAASRLSIAAICLIPIWRTVSRETREAAARSASSQVSSQVSRRPAIVYSIAAGLILALHFATWITSLSYTSIAVSATLVTTNPIWVALLSWWWFQEKPSSRTSWGIAIALLGGGLIAIADSTSTHAGSNPLLGNVLALVGSWAVSLYFLLGREAQRQGLSMSSHIVFTYTTAAIALLPLPYLFHTPYTGYPIAVYGYILLMGLVPQLIGHTSFNWAVRWSSPTFVTLTILAEPVGSSILGFMIFQENPGKGVIVGAIVILLGVAIAAIGERKQ